MLILFMDVIHIIIDITPKGGARMPDYKKMYFQLAARVADVVELLIEAQQEGEISCIEDECRLKIDLADSEKLLPE